MIKNSSPKFTMGLRLFKRRVF